MASTLAPRRSPTDRSFVRMEHSEVHGYSRVAQLALRILKARSSSSASFPGSPVSALSAAWRTSLGLQPSSCCSSLGTPALSAASPSGFSSASTNYQSSCAARSFNPFDRFYRKSSHPSASSLAGTRTLPPELHKKKTLASVVLAFVHAKS